MEDLFLYVSMQVPQEAPQFPRKWAFEVQGNALWIARAKTGYSNTGQLGFKNTAAQYSAPPASARLDDGSFIVLLEGTEHRAFNAETMRNLLKLKAERDSLSEQNNALKDQVTALEQIRSLDDKIASNYEERIEMLDEMCNSCDDVRFIESPVTQR